MARKRFNQKHSANIVYQNYQKHREIVYDNKYHNALFIGNVSDKPDWRQYKHRLILGNIYARPSSGSSTFLCASIDVDNRYVSFNPNKGLNREFGEITFTNSFATDGEMASVNGHDWFRIEFEGDRTGYTSSAFSNDSISIILTESNMIYVKLFRFIPYGFPDVDGDGRIRYKHKAVYYDTIEVPPFESTTSINSFRFCGQSQNGIFIYVIDPNSSYSAGKTGRLFDITSNGYTLLKEVYDSDYNNAVDFCENKILKGNGIYCSIHNYVTKTSPKQEGIYLDWASTDNPTNWNRSIVIPQENLVNNGIGMFAYFNGGYFYVYAMNSIKVSTRVSKAYYRLFKSSDCQNWIQVELPTYYDVDIIENDGKHGCIGDSSYQKVRLVLDERETIPTEDGVTKARFSPNSVINSLEAMIPWGHMFIDGGMNVQKSTSFMVSVVSGDTTYCVYTDNMECIESENNFAFAYPTSGVNQNGEVVQEGDYCAPNG